MRYPPTPIGDKKKDDIIGAPVKAKSGKIRPPQLLRRLKAKRRQIVADVMASQGAPCLLTKHRASLVVAFLNSHEYVYREVEKVEISMKPKEVARMALSTEVGAEQEEWIRKGVELCTKRGNIATLDFITTLHIGEIATLHHELTNGVSKFDAQKYVNLFYTKTQIDCQGNEKLKRHMMQAYSIFALYRKFPDVVYCKGINRTNIAPLTDALGRFVQTVSGSSKIEAWRSGEMIEEPIDEDDWSRLEAPKVGNESDSDLYESADASQDLSDEE